MSTISERLKAAYESKGMSYQELSKICSVPRATIQRYVSGTTDRIDIDKLQEICRVLDVDASDVIGWSKDSPKADLDARFGNLIKRERIRLNWTIEKMAKELGTSPDLLKLYESGERIPNFSTAVIWAVQLGIPINAYDPQYKSSCHEPIAEELDMEIIRLLSSLSDSSRIKALAYLQGLKDNEDKR